MTSIAQIMSIISLIVSTIIAMVIHELGHLGAAKLCKVSASELGIGCGPELFSFRLSGIKYSIRLYPVASYVRMNGSELQQKPLSRQLFVHLAGIIVNFVAAFLTYGTFFGWINLLTAIANLLPLYPQDGWKCGVALIRSLTNNKNQFAQRTFTYCGGFLSLSLIGAVLYYTF